MGDSGVGKTSFIRRVTKDTYEESMMPTVGIDYESRSLFIDNQAVHLKFWDTAGQVYIYIYIFKIYN